MLTRRAQSRARKPPRRDRPGSRADARAVRPPSLLVHSIVSPSIPFPRRVAPAGLGGSSGSCRTAFPRQRPCAGHVRLSRSRTKGWLSGSGHVCVLKARASPRRLLGSCCGLAPPFAWSQERPRFTLPPSSLHKRAKSHYWMNFSRRVSKHPEEEAWAFEGLPRRDMRGFKLLSKI